MRWSVDERSWPHDASSGDLEERVAGWLDRQVDAPALWSWLLVAGTFLVMVLFASLH